MPPSPVLRRLTGPPRLCVGLFAGSVLGFLPLAQVNLWVQAGGGSLPTAAQVLERYHGSPERTVLHRVLDPDLAPDDPSNMVQFLGGGAPTDPVTVANRGAILGWVEAGAPREGWPAVAPIFTGVETCGACHTPGGERSDLPFETYEQVLPLTVPGGGMALAPLLISAHNHLFGFSVLALLVGLGVAMSSAPRRLQYALVALSFLGAVVDIAAWFLTRAHGSPFHYLVMAGGGLFGSGIAAGAAVILLDTLRARHRAAGNPA